MAIDDVPRRHDAEHVAVVHELLGHLLEQLPDARRVAEVEVQVVDEEEEDAARGVVGGPLRRQDDALLRRRRRRQQLVQHAPAVHEDERRHSPASRRLRRSGNRPCSGRPRTDHSSSRTMTSVVTRSMAIRKVGAPGLSVGACRRRLAWGGWGWRAIARRGRRLRQHGCRQKARENTHASEAS